MENKDDNSFLRSPGFAMILTIFAGLTTCLGALIVLNKRLIHLANPTYVAVALGFSGGVMIYISFTEIFQEAVENIVDWKSCCHINVTRNEKDKICDKHCEGLSLLIVTSLFFGGAVLIFILDKIVHMISPEVEHEIGLEELNALNRQAGNKEQNTTITNRNETRLTMQTSRERLNSSLIRTGILTAVALAIHNLPEGFAVFTDAASKKSSTVPLLVIGIALHNIPEGIAIAVPVYYAKRSKSLAFLFTAASGLAEPVGGALAWILKVLTGKDGENPLVVGLTFGAVAGIMVTIVLKELIPSAYSLSKSKDLITISIIFGMLFIAVSVVLLSFFGS